MGASELARLMIVAGEASGDLHASHLVRALREQRPGLEVFGFGGDRLAAAGVELACRLTDYQAIGYTEILRSVPALAYQYLRARRMLAQRRPDALVVVDFPTFNVPLAQAATRAGIPVHYFIPPKVWGWKGERARDVARAAAKIYTIFPFEAECYAPYGGRTFYFGHPLVDFTRPAADPGAFARRIGFEPASPIVALLPGSRRQEIETMLDRYLEVARRLAESGLAAQFAIPRAITVPTEWLQSRLARAPYRQLQVRIVDDALCDLLASSTLALATCGTVTLEAAICGCPMVISYDSGALTRWLFRRRRHAFRFFGLPNIVAGREVCPERVGEDATPDTLFETASRLLSEPRALADQKRGLAEITASLGQRGVFMKVAAEILRPA